MIACEPDGGFESKKKRTGKENRKQTYLEEQHKKEILGGEPDKGCEPCPGPRIIWAHPLEEIKPEIKVRVREKEDRKSQCGFYSIRDIFVCSVVCGTFIKLMVACETF